MRRYRYRFPLLLGALLLLLLTAPLTQGVEAAGGTDVRGLVVGLLFATVVVTGVIAASESRRTIVFAVLLGLPPFCLQLLFPEASDVTLSKATHAFTLVFLIYALVPIVRFLVRGRRVTLDTICAALCTYLLIGIIFASAYSLLELYDTKAFNTPGSVPFSERSEDSIYFSFVTLTTLGYGDITPASPGARTLAMFEAILGQFFLTVLVAWLVGLYIASGREQPPE